jgi:hypothetical protein
MRRAIAVALAFAALAPLSARAAQVERNGFTFETPPGWYSLDTAVARQRMSALPPDLRQFALQGDLALVAFDRDPSVGSEASLNVRLQAGSPRLSLEAWRAQLDRERALAQQHGMAITIVESSIASLGIVPVGRAIVDTRWGENAQRQLVYWVPSPCCSALLTYATSPQLFEGYLSRFERSFFTTRGAAEPGTLDRFFCNLNPQLAGQLGGLCGFSTALLGFFLIYRKMQRK